MANPDDSNNERRGSERVAVNREFEDVATTYVSDLSSDGVFVHTLERLEEGSVVELHFTLLLDDPVPIDAAGEVVRISKNPPGVGVRFTSLAEESRKAIESLVERDRPQDSGTPLFRAPAASASTSSGKLPAGSFSASAMKQAFEDAKTSAFAPVGGPTDGIFDDDDEDARTSPHIAVKAPLANDGD